MAIHDFIDVYEDSIYTFSPEVIKEFKMLLLKLKEEVTLLNKLASLKGGMKMILAGSAVAEQQKLVQKNQPHNLVPSEEAKQNLIVNLT